MALKYSPVAKVIHFKEKEEIFIIKCCLLCLKTFRVLSLLCYTFVYITRFSDKKQSI